MKKNSRITRVKGMLLLGWIFFYSPAITPKEHQVRETGKEIKPEIASMLTLNKASVAPALAEAYSKKLAASKKDTF